MLLHELQSSLILMEYESFFSNISSPVVPSPRVNPCTKRPFSYFNETANPSILSYIYSTLPIFSRIRWSNFLKSSSLNALPKLNIGVS